jgi:hypothetical protein
LVQQLLRRNRLVTVMLPLGDDLALVGNMPLGFGNVPLSLRQVAQYQSPPTHSRLGWPRLTSTNSIQARGGIWAPTLV